MSRIDIAVLASRILALWLFAQTAMLIGSVITVVMIGVFGSEGQLLSALVMAVPALTMLVTGIVFWWKAPSIAKRMIADRPASVSVERVESSDLMSIACVAIGLFVLVPVVRDLAGSLFDVVTNKYRFSEWWADGRWRSDLLSSIVALVFSLCLIFGSRGFVRVFMWLRIAGTPIASKNNNA